MDKLEKRFLIYFRLLLGAAVLLYAVSAFLPPTFRIWGLNHLYYTPKLLSFFLLSVGTLFLFPRTQEVILGAYTSSKKYIPKVGISFSPVQIILSFFCGVFLFWRFKIATFLLGDSQLLFNDLNLLSREADVLGLMKLAWSTSYPLAAGISYAAVIIGETSFGLKVEEVLQGLSSIVGGIYVAGILYYLRKIFTDSLMVFFGLAILCTQGAVLLFFGYVEFYSFILLGFTLYGLSGVCVLRKCGSLIAPTILFILSIGFHRVSIVLLPSFLFLLFYAFYGKKLSRYLNLRNVAYGLAATALLMFLYYLFSGEYQLRNEFLPLKSKDVRISYTLFSIPHLIDYLNYLFLISPTSLIIILLSIFLLRNSNFWNEPVILFLIILVAFQQIAVFTANVDLGFARDWDVMAPLGVGLVVLSIYILERGLTNSIRKGVLAGLFGAIFIFFVPWVTLHANEKESVERFENLISMDKESLASDRIAYSYEVLSIYYRGKHDFLKEKYYLSKAIEETKNIRLLGNMVILLNRMGVQSSDNHYLVEYVDGFRIDVQRRKEKGDVILADEYLAMFYVALRMLREQGFCETAEPFYRQAVDLDFPQKGYAYVGLGQCAKEKGEISRAVEYFNMTDLSTLELVDRDLKIIRDTYRSFVGKKEFK